MLSFDCFCGFRRGNVLFQADEKSAEWLVIWNDMTHMWRHSNKKWIPTRCLALPINE